MIHKNTTEDQRMRYDRAFLLLLRHSPLSSIRPAGCDDPDLMLDEPLIPCDGIEAGQFSEDYFTHFTQGFTRGHTKHILTRVSLTDDANLLHTSKNPWKASHQDLEKKKSLEAAVLFIMNRLTPSNFKKLAEEIKSLDIQTFEDLKLVVDVIFDKVTIETKFVQAYASLCQFMLGFQVVPPPNMAQNRATFRAILVTKCQQEFEADKNYIFEDPEKIKNRIMEEMPDDIPARTEKIETTLYQMKLRRLKYFGNIGFIGELFKLGILPEVIIHSCISRLLSSRDSESMFSLCKLISTVGKHIDKPKVKVHIDKYFTTIKQIAEESTSRLKFALKDLIDLRKNKWKPRAAQAGPKTLAEVHKEFKEEQANKEVLQSVPLNQQSDKRFFTPSRAQTATPSKTSDRFREIRNPVHASIEGCSNKNKKQDTTFPMVEDKENCQTWSHVKSKGKKKQNRQCSSNVQTQDNTGKKKVTKEQKKQTGFLSNAFYLESESEDENKMDEPENEKIDLTRFKISKARDQNVRLAPGGFNFRLPNLQATDEKPKEKLPASNRYDLLDDIDDDSVVETKFSKNVKTDSDISSSVGTAEELPQQSPAVKITLLTEEQAELRARNIIDEFLNCRDHIEAQQCIRELLCQTNGKLVVTTIINHVMEKSNDARLQTGQLLLEIMEIKIISLDEFNQGFSEILSFAADIVIDIPMLWRYLAQIVSPLLETSMPLKECVELLSKNLEPDHCALLLAQIFIIVKENEMKNSTSLLDAWSYCGFSWEQFMAADRVNSFLEDRKLLEIFSNRKQSQTNDPNNQQNVLDNYKTGQEVNTPLCEQYPSASEQFSHSVEHKSEHLDICLKAEHVDLDYVDLDYVTVTETNAEQTDTGNVHVLKDEGNTTANLLTDDIVSQNTICDSDDHSPLNTICDNVDQAPDNTNIIGDKVERSNLNTPINTDEPEHSDEEGEAIWRQEMAEDEAFFASKVIKVNSVEKRKYYICFCPSNFSNETVMWDSSTEKLVNSEACSENKTDFYTESTQENFPEASGEACVPLSIDAPCFVPTYYRAQSESLTDCGLCYSDMYKEYPECSTSSSSNSQADSGFQDLNEMSPPMSAENLCPIQENLESTTQELNDFKTTELSNWQSDQQGLHCEYSTNAEDLVNNISDSFFCNGNIPLSFHQSSQISLKSDYSNTDPYLSVSDRLDTECDQVNPAQFSSASSCEELPGEGPTGFTKLNPWHTEHCTPLDRLKFSLSPLMKPCAKIQDVEACTQPCSQIHHIELCVESCAPTHSVESCAPTHSVESCAPTHSVESCAPTHHLESCASTHHLESGTPTYVESCALPHQIKDFLETLFPENFMSKCKQVIDDFEKLLQENRASQDILNYIQEYPQTREVQIFLLSLLTSSLGTMALRSPLGNRIIKDRKDLMQSLIGNDPDLELLAVRALFHLTPHAQHPHEIVCLYADMFKEGLVSFDVLYNWCLSIGPGKNNQDEVVFK